MENMKQKIRLYHADLLRDMAVVALFNFYLRLCAKEFMSTA